MYLFSKLFTYLFLPPGIFILTLMLAAFLIKKRRVLFFAMALLFYLLSTKYIANILLAPLENITYKDSNASIVVVLGGGSNINDIIKADNEAFKREFVAFLLAKKRDLSMVFSGGGKRGEEALAAKRDFALLQNISFSKIKIYYENQSRNTKENALYSKILFEKEHLPKDIYLVTSAYHMPRAKFYFENAGFRVVAKVSNYYQDYSYEFYDFLPQMKYFSYSYKAIHEYIGLLFAKISKKFSSSF